MTTICGKPSPGVTISPAIFADLTDVEVTEVRWEGSTLCVEFDGDLDDATAGAAHLRLISASPTDESERSTLLDTIHALVADRPDDPLAAYVALLSERILRPTVEG